MLNQVVDLSLYGKSRKAKLMFSDHPFLQSEWTIAEKYKLLIIHREYDTAIVISS